MTVSAIESTPGPYGLAKPAASTTSAGGSSDKDMFLQLMVAQLRYQDPANPTDSAEFLAQTAQFTALEKMEAVADQTAELVALQVSFGASGMVGRTVSYPGPDGTLLSGVVSSVRFQATGPVLQVNGEDVAFGSVQAVGDGSTDLTLMQPADDEAQTAPSAQA